MEAWDTKTVVLNSEQCAIIGACLSRFVTDAGMNLLYNAQTSDFETTFKHVNHLVDLTKKILIDIGMDPSQQLQ